MQSLPQKAKISLAEPVSNGFLHVTAKALNRYNPGKTEGEGVFLTGVLFLILLSAAVTD